MRPRKEILKSDRPSSFPGIWKQPSGRDDHFRSVTDWINAKRIDDNLNGLWRVHDKIYDLETFIKHHPGGSDWLEISRGCDITEAFEVSHVANPSIAEKTLEAYFVRDVTTPRMSPYTFYEYGFFKILKSRTEPILKLIGGTGPTDRIKRMMDGIAVFYIFMIILATIQNSTILQILAGLNLTMTVIGAHNFLHLRENWRKYYMDLSWLSSYEFRVSHVFSHHLFPNTILDFEISVYEPMLEFLPKRNKTWIQRYGPVVYNHVVYLINFLVTLVIRWKGIVSSKQEFRPEFTLVFLHLGLCLVLGPDVASGFKSWLVTHFAASYFFNLCGLNAAHHDPSIFHDGDEARADPDFGLCQLDAVRERSDWWIQDSLFVQLVVFGEHSLHHLFPTICLSKLKLLRPILKETLEEFNEKFPAMTQWEHFLGSLAQLRRTEKKGIEERKSSAEDQCKWK